MNQFKTIQWPFAITFLGAMFAWNLSGMSFSAPSNHSKDVSVLVKERREVLVKLVDVLRTRHERGSISLEPVLRAQQDLLNAELESAKNREERLAAMNSQLSLLRAMEKRAMELQSVGSRGGEMETVLAATAGRLQIEIQIERELSAGK